MKPVRLDHAFDTARADGEAGLTELLGDDIDRGIGIEEAVANDLSFDLVGADVVGLGTAFLRLEGRGSLFLKEFEQLIITLSGEAVLGGSLGGAESFALTFEEHEQAWSDLVIGGDDEFSRGSDDAVLWELELHDRALDLGRAGRRMSQVVRIDDKGTGRACQIKYGGIGRRGGGGREENQQECPCFTGRRMEVYRHILFDGEGGDDGALSGHSVKDSQIN